MHPLFVLYKPTNFSNNYRHLQQAILQAHTSSRRDKQAIEDDRKLFPVKEVNSIGTVRFHGSKSEELMIAAIKDPKYSQYCNPVGKGGVKNPMPTSVRKTLYEENEEVNELIGGYPRWSRLLSSKLEGAKIESFEWRKKRRRVTCRHSERMPHQIYNNNQSQ